MKRIIALLCILPLFLTGCVSWLDGSYQSITPHMENNSPIDTANLSAKNIDELKSILINLVKNSASDGVIALSEYDRSSIAKDFETAVQFVMEHDPITAYAVEEIIYELGTSAGKLAATVSISYIHGSSDIRNILSVPSITFAKDAIANAMNKCSAGIVLYITNYSETDFHQYVSDYASTYPDRIMECPGVTVNIYPDDGVERVVELKFTYQTSTDSLKNMQKVTETFFEAAAILVSSTSDEQQKFSQLYSVLSSRHNNQTQASITPAYSLVEYGIGDAKTVANVYAAMCRKAALDCWTVSGTKDGQLWHWNILKIGDEYYHLDFLECKKNGAFVIKTTAQMDRYVWDYSAYPISQTAS